MVKHPVLTERATDQQVTLTFHNFTNNYLIHELIHKITIDVNEETGIFHQN